MIKRIGRMLLSAVRMMITRAASGSGAYSFDLANGSIIIASRDDCRYKVTVGPTYYYINKKTNDIEPTITIINSRGKKTPNTLTVTASASINLSEVLINPAGSSPAINIATPSYCEVNLVLNNVELDTSAGNAPAFLISAGAGAVNIELGGINTCKSAASYAGLQKESIGANSLLTITGNGSLTATGGKGGAGIGGGGSDLSRTYYGNCEYISIVGGTITATGGEGGAGIGGGGSNLYAGYGNNISISGGSINAIGQGGGAGIGGGRREARAADNNRIDPDTSCNSISISGGTVTATGSGIGVGIGRGGALTITGGSVNAYVDVASTTVTNGRVPVYKLSATLATNMHESSNNLPLNYIIALLDYPYGCTDMKPEDDRMLYLWLPQDTEIKGVSAEVEHRKREDFMHYSEAVPSLDTPIKIMADNNNAATFTRYCYPDNLTVAAPTITVAEDGRTVTLASATPGAAIFYNVTIGGTMSNLKRYTGPFHHDANCTIKAIALANSINSAISTRELD